MNLLDEIVETGVFLKDQYFDLRGLRLYSSICISTLRDHIKRDKLPAFTVRGKILVRRSEFDQWMNRFRTNKGQDVSRIADEVIARLKPGKSDK